MSHSAFVRTFSLKKKFFVNLFFLAVKLNNGHWKWLGSCWTFWMKSLLFYFGFICSFVRHFFSICVSLLRFFVPSSFIFWVHLFFCSSLLFYFRFVCSFVRHFFSTLVLFAHLFVTSFLFSFRLFVLRSSFLALNRKSVLDTCAEGRKESFGKMRISFSR